MRRFSNAQYVAHLPFGDRIPGSPPEPVSHAAWDFGAHGREVANPDATQMEARDIINLESVVRQELTSS
jgi:hypothetical protein